MKIKKRDLIQLIREMSLDEQAYMGMPNIQRGQEAPDSGPLDLAFKKRRNLSQIERYFRSPGFSEKATKFYGEDHGFPGSNIWIIPQIGDPRSPELQFDKDEQGYKPNRRYSNTLMISSRRGEAYDISENLLKSLGMPEEVIANVNFANDIILVPRVSSIAGNKDQFLMSSPHMIIHSLFDGGALSRIPEVKRSMILAKRQAFDANDDDGIIQYYIEEIGHPDGPEFIGLVAPITKALRKAGAAEGEDVINEILTGCLLYNRLEEIEVDSKYDAYIRKKRKMGVKELIASAVKASRDFLKGKIALVEIL